MSHLDDVIIYVRVSEDDENNVIVEDPLEAVSETVELGPSPTWPSADERNDAIARAVRNVLDRVYEMQSGTPIDRLKVEF